MSLSSHSGPTYRLKLKYFFFKLESCHSCFALKRHNNIYSKLKLTKSEIMVRPNSMRIVQLAEQNSSRSSVIT